MSLDITGTQTTGVQGDDLLVKPRKPTLVLPDQGRIKTTLAIPGNRQNHLTIVAQNRLLARAIAMITRLLFGLSPKMRLHLRVEHPFRQGFLQIPKQTL